MQRLFYGISILCLAVVALFALRGFGVATTPSYMWTVQTTTEVTFNFGLAFGSALSAALWAGIGKIIELLQVIAIRLAPAPQSYLNNTAPNASRRSILDA